MAKSEIEAGPTSRTVAENMTRLRQRRQYTLVQLSERTAEMGRELAISTLSLIAKGKRRIDVDDLLILAAALDVSPIALLVPDAPDDEIVPVTGFPKGTTPQRLLEWMTGGEHLLSVLVAGLSDAEFLNLTVDFAKAKEQRDGNN